MSRPRRQTIIAAPARLLRVAILVAGLGGAALVGVGAAVAQTPSPTPETPPVVAPTPTPGVGVGATTGGVSGVGLGVWATTAPTPTRAAPPSPATRITTRSNRAGAAMILRRRGIDISSALPRS